MSGAKRAAKVARRRARRADHQRRWLAWLAERVGPGAARLAEWRAAIYRALRAKKDEREAAALARCVAKPRAPRAKCAAPPLTKGPRALEKARRRAERGTA